MGFVFYIVDAIVVLEAINNATDGDTILINSGIYVEKVTQLL